VRRVGLTKATSPARGVASGRTLPGVRPCRVRRSGSSETREGGADIAVNDNRINEQIRAREVRLIGADGSQLGIKPLPQALVQAREQGLDLVEVAPMANPPVCRIMDFKKFQYDEQQKRKESRRKATNIIIKEMKFRPKIDQHDYATKMKHVERFLAEGSKVKLTIMFRGREVAHPELGMKILEKVAEQVREIAVIEASPKLDGRNMTMVLAPSRRPGGKPTKAAPLRPGEGGSAPAPAEAAAPAPSSEPVASTAEQPAPAGGAVSAV
jgi:translation initiation factor IF-3